VLPVDNHFIQFSIKVGIIKIILKSYMHDFLGIGLVLRVKQSFNHTEGIFTPLPKNSRNYFLAGCVTIQN